MHVVMLSATGGVSIANCHNQFHSTEKVFLTLKGGKPGATSVFKDDLDKFGSQQAFKRQWFQSRDEDQRSFPWISAEGLPQTVHIHLPKAVAVAGFSFRSRAEPIINGIYSKGFILGFSPTKFDFVGSDDCQSWTTILSVSNVQWTTYDEEQLWEISSGNQEYFKCYGFRVHTTLNKPQAAIQDAKLWIGK